MPSAACLAGYTAAWWLCALFEWDRVYCWDAACGVLAAAWTMAGISKLQLAGADWFRSGALGLLVAERSFLGPEPIRRLRRAFLRSPVACLLLGGFGLVIELMGWLFCIPEARPFFAANSTALLFGIALLLGYFELEWTVLAISLAVITNV